MAAAERPHDDLELHLHVFGSEHVIETRARIGPTRFLELLPLARAISAGVSAIALGVVESEGRTVSCRAGCSACCRQAIPIAPAEAVRLAEVVEAMPKERRRAVTRRFEKALQRLEKAGLVKPGGRRGEAAFLSAEVTPAEAWEDVSRRYFEAAIPCPFLEDERCGIYGERPMVCREYSVTTPAELCSSLSPEIRDVPRPVRMSEVMAAAGNAVLERQDPSIPLVLALEWARVHRAAFAVEGDGEELAGALLAQIEAESGDERP